MLPFLGRVHGKSRGGWTTKIHLVAAGPDCPLIFHLSPGNAHDGPEGRKLIERLKELLAPGCKLLMDKAYCGSATFMFRLRGEAFSHPSVLEKFWGATVLSTLPT